MSEEKKFTDLGEAIEYVISQLSENEKDIIANGDSAGLHLGLAGWVRSEILSNESLNLTELIYEKIRKETPHYNEHSEEPLFIHPDNITGYIIDELICKLNKTHPQS